MTLFAKARCVAGHRDAATPWLDPGNSPARVAEQMLFILSFPTLSIARHWFFVGVGKILQERNRPS